MIGAGRKGPRAAATRRKPAEAASPSWRIPWRDALELGVAFLLVAGTAAGVRLLRDPSVLPVRTVHVEGRLQHLDPQRLRAAVLDGLRGNFFTVDLERLEASVTALPWVARAQVRREWPLALRIRIEEQEPVARWGPHALLNRRGEVFMPGSIEDSLARRLPVLYGPEGHSVRVLEAWSRLVDRLARVGLRPVALYLDERRAWRAWLEGRLELAFGRGDLDTPLERLLQVWPQRLAARAQHIERVDLRYTNGLAVRWKAGSGEGSVPQWRTTDA